MAVFGAPRTVTVTTTTTLLAGNDSYGTKRKLHNMGAASIFLGGANVAASGANKGWTLAAGATIDIDSGTAIYGIIAAATADVLVWEFSN